MAHLRKEDGSEAPMPNEVSALEKLRRNFVFESPIGALGMSIVTDMRILYANSDPVKEAFP